MDNATEAAKVRQFDMKRNPLGAVLVGLVLLSAVGTAFLAYAYIQSMRDLNRLQAQSAAIQRNRAVASALATDAIEYSKTHPDIDPILQSVGIKSAKGQAATTNNVPQQ